ncbi:MAG: type III-D CRISPR-associated protein Csx19, partial [Methylococcales bacterium]
CLREVLSAAWSDAGGIVLGHAFDGVIWGRMKDGLLELASDPPNEIGATLRMETLLDLRLFNAGQELRVWRTDSGMRALRLAEAGTGQVYAAYQDRSYELLRQPNPKYPHRPAPFVILEGLAGQRHSPPGEPVPTRLAVRHYFAEDEETGLLCVAQHRLLGLEP